VPPHTTTIFCRLHTLPTLGCSVGTVVKINCFRLALKTASLCQTPAAAGRFPGTQHPPTPQKSNQDSHYVVEFLPTRITWHAHQNHVHLDAISNPQGPNQGPGLRAQPHSNVLSQSHEIPDRCIERRPAAKRDTMGTRFKQHEILNTLS
jgi:hypothetical protein